MNNIRKIYLWSILVISILEFFYFGSKALLQTVILYENVILILMMMSLYTLKESKQPEALENV